MLKNQILTFFLTPIDSSITTQCSFHNDGPGQDKDPFIADPAVTRSVSLSIRSPQHTGQHCFRLWVRVFCTYWLEQIYKITGS